MSWLFSKNRLEKVPFVSVPHTSSNRLLLSNQDEGCTPSVAHSLALPLGPALLNLWTILSRGALCWKIGYQRKSKCLKLQLLKSDGICLKGWCAGNIECNRARWVSKFRKINQLSYCVTFLYVQFITLSLVRYLTMSRNFSVVVHFEARLMVPSKIVDSKVLKMAIKFEYFFFLIRMCGLYKSSAPEIQS